MLTAECKLRELLRHVKRRTRLRSLKLILVSDDFLKKRNYLNGIITLCTNVTSQRERSNLASILSLMIALRDHFDKISRVRLHFCAHNSRALEK